MASSTALVEETVPSQGPIWNYTSSSQVLSKNSNVKTLDRLSHGPENPKDCPFKKNDQRDLQNRALLTLSSTTAKSTNLWNTNKVYCIRDQTLLCLGTKPAAGLLIMIFCCSTSMKTRTKQIGSTLIISGLQGKDKTRTRTRLTSLNIIIRTSKESCMYIL